MSRSGEEVEGAQEPQEAPGLAADLRAAEHPPPEFSGDDAEPGPMMDVGMMVTATAASTRRSSSPDEVITTDPTLTGIGAVGRKARSLPPGVQHVGNARYKEY